MYVRQDQHDDIDASHIHISPDPNMASTASLGGNSRLGGVNQTAEMEEILREQARVEQLLQQIDLEIFKVKGKGPSVDGGSGGCSS